MKDQRGLYYYPNPAHKAARMYVRENQGRIEFRLWSSDEPDIWDRHQWLPLDVIRMAAGMYKEMGREADPTAMYDEGAARALIEENR